MLDVLPDAATLPIYSGLGSAKWIQWLVLRLTPPHVPCNRKYQMQKFLWNVQISILDCELKNQSNISQSCNEQQFQNEVLSWLNVWLLSCFWTVAWLCVSWQICLGGKPFVKVICTSCYHHTDNYLDLLKGGINDNEPVLYHIKHVVA